MAVDALADYRSGSTEPWCVDVLCSLVRAKKPHRLLETGTFEGRTTLELLRAMLSYADQHGSHIQSIESDHERAKAASDYIGNSQGPIAPGVGWEVTVYDATQYITDYVAKNSLDFVFLDDDHTATHVAEELVALKDKMRPGGIICMHDVVGPFGLGQLCRSAGGIVLEFDRLHAAGGLGIIAL